MDVLEPTLDGMIRDEPDTSTAVFTFGRFNPPTVGHHKMLQKLVEVGEQERGDVFVFVSHTKDKKKNPLTHQQKIMYMKEMFPEMRDYVDPKDSLRTVFDIALYLKDYKRLVMVVGEDRVDGFRKMLEKYNGQELKNGTYDFESIQVVNAGSRDPDSEGVEGMSASKMREAVKNNDMNTFNSGLPEGYDGSRLFQDIKDAM